MIKELTEYPEKQFKHIIPFGDYLICKTEKHGCDNNRIVIERFSKYNDKIEMKIIYTIEFDWEEVKQAYTFEEAYADCIKNGTKYYCGYIESEPSGKMYCAITPSGNRVMVYRTDKLSSFTLTSNWYKED